MEEGEGDLALPVVLVLWFTENIYKKTIFFETPLIIMSLSDDRQGVASAAGLRFVQDAVSNL